MVRGSRSDFVWVRNRAVGQQKMKRPAIRATDHGQAFAQAAKQGLSSAALAVGAEIEVPVEN